MFIIIQCKKYIDYYFKLSQLYIYTIIRFFNINTFVCMFNKFDVYIYYSMYLTFDRKNITSYYIVYI